MQLLLHLFVMVLNLNAKPQSGEVKSFKVRSVVGRLHKPVRKMQLILSRVSNHQTKIYKSMQKFPTHHLNKFLSNFKRRLQFDLRDESNLFSFHQHINSDG